MGDDALGAITGNWYSAELDITRATRSSSTAIQRDYKVDPGVYAAETYLCCEVLEQAVKDIGGKVEDKAALKKALHEREGAEHAPRPGAASTSSATWSATSTSARSRRRAARYVNTVIKTYPNVSQFWTYNKDEFLKNPVYSRDFPPSKNLEN